MKIAIDRDYLRDTLVDLVRINSINPGTAPTGLGEAEIAAYVAGALHKLGWRWPPTSLSRDAPVW
jgi:acetylornithine deacetylase